MASEGRTPLQVPSCPGRTLRQVDVVHDAQSWQTASLPHCRTIRLRWWTRKQCEQVNSSGCFGRAGIVSCSPERSTPGSSRPSTKSESTTSAMSGELPAGGRAILRAVRRERTRGRRVVGRSRSPTCFFSRLLRVSGSHRVEVMEAGRAARPMASMTCRDLSVAAPFSAHRRANWVSAPNCSGASKCTTHGHRQGHQHRLGLGQQVKPLQHLRASSGLGPGEYLPTRDRDRRACRLAAVSGRIGFPRRSLQRPRCRGVGPLASFAPLGGAAIGLPSTRVVTGRWQGPAPMAARRSLSFQHRPDSGSEQECQQPADGSTAPRARAPTGHTALMVEYRDRGGVLVGIDPGHRPLPAHLG